MTSERLKILFLTNWYPTGAEPARAVWVREQAKAARLYDDVSVLHCIGTDPELRRSWRMEAEADERLCEGVPLHRLRYRPSPIPKASYFLYLWSCFQAFRQMANQGFRPDVIHVHVYDAGAPAILIGALDRIPVVVTEHFSSFPRRLLGHLDVCKAWLAFRWANRVLPVSHSLRKAIEDYGIRANFEVVPNVADTTLFFPPSPPRAESDHKRILFVGQLAPVKGVPYLLHALSRLRRKRDDWHLNIVGDGPARIEYEQLALGLKLGEKVTFHGLKTKQDVAAFMRRASLFVISSLTETFSVPAAEALATGTPILATRCGGLEEFVISDVGLLVRPGDADALSEGLDYMLDNLCRYSSEQISQYAKKHFSPEIVGATLHAVYESVSRDKREVART